MMDFAAMLLSFTALFMLKISSLPELYHYVANKRGIRLKDLRSMEKLGLKVRKLHLDVKYSESCLDLGILPSALRMDNVRIQEYKNNLRLNEIILKERLSSTRKKLAEKNVLYLAEYKRIMSSLSLVERTSLQSPLAEYYDKEMEVVNNRHHKKNF